MLKNRSRLWISVVLIVTTLGCGSEKAAKPETESERVRINLERAGGDPGKLSPEDRTAYEKLVPKGSETSRVPGLPGTAAAKPDR